MLYFFYFTTDVGIIINSFNFKKLTSVKLYRLDIKRNNKNQMETVLISIKQFYMNNIDCLIKSLFTNYTQPHLIMMTATVGAVVLLYLFTRPGNSKSKRNKKTVNHVKPLTLEQEIDQVLYKYDTVYKDGITTLYKDFDAKNENMRYQCSYYNEMLLGLLIQLDGIDLSRLDNESKLILKEKRKCVIRNIQSELKKLDKLIA